MPKILKSDDGNVSLRLDGAYVAGGKYLVEPYIRENDDGTTKKSYFGSFKFQDTKKAKQILQKAVKESPYEDTVFYGQYPNWTDDEYGEGLQVQNRVKFYKSINAREEIPEDNIRDYVYALEVHLKKSREDGIFLICARAIATGENTFSYDDDLFEDLFDENVPVREHKEDTIKDNTEERETVAKPAKKTQDTKTKDPKDISDIDIEDDDLPF